VHTWLSRLRRGPDPQAVDRLLAVVLTGGAELEIWLGSDAAHHRLEAAEDLGSLLGLVELAFGEHLRRKRRIADARPHLGAALELFTRLGADPWAGRARSELGASSPGGGHAHTSLSALTCQELEVALKVADGLTNREVGAALFLSHKTIETHLGRVYRKLGLRSRTELTRLLASHALEYEPPQA